MKTDAPAVRLEYETGDAGELYLKYDDSFGDTAVPELKVIISTAPAGTPGNAPGSFNTRELTVFSQKAMTYGRYSKYLKSHGCACCSLTTVLGGYCEKYRGLRPDGTLSKVEKAHFRRIERLFNYMRPLPLQMPVTLHGISRILKAEGIANRYVHSFKDSEAVKEIKGHLLTGRPVIVETSRMRRENGKIADRRDKKYAGSYHTQILLGMTREGKAIFADSADRPWSGSRQRLKETDLSDLIKYMYPQEKTSDRHDYHPGRKGTGGYILIDEPLNK